jgi:hypothetical protein
MKFTSTRREEKGREEKSKEENSKEEKRKFNFEAYVFFIDCEKSLVH